MAQTLKTPQISKLENSPRGTDNPPRYASIQFEAPPPAFGREIVTFVDQLPFPKSLMQKTTFLFVYNFYWARVYGLRRLKKRQRKKREWSQGGSVTLIFMKLIFKGLYCLLHWPQVSRLHELFLEVAHIQPRQPGKIHDRSLKNSFTIEPLMELPRFFL